VGYVNLNTEGFGRALKECAWTSYPVLPKQGVKQPPAILENEKPGVQIPGPTVNSTVVAKSRPKGSALKFVKEWGGVATVLIAILYTSPIQVASA
jgi:hypothetical protein